MLGAAEKRWARAKDAAKLQQAIRMKLEAQAEFVGWWDTQAEKLQGARGTPGPGRGNKTALQNGNAVYGAGANGLPDRVTIHRWRRALGTPEAFEATYEAVCGRYPRIIELQMTACVGQSTGDTEWFTPTEVIELARDVMGGIDLDPASTAAANRIVKARQFFTRERDGLAQAWNGRIWMNPPYAHPLMTLFMDKLAGEVERGGVSAAVVLVNNATETAWFRALTRVSSAVCFPHGRVVFSHHGKPATPAQGQAVLYVGGQWSRFHQVFAAIGDVWIKP